ncbi:MAG: sugar fermentation stimulation protein SfsA, partial [Gemmatimonadales bacterium]|nr:sugar fermentation stimulation protein SfsA [Gemmatimonadales bacterium]NIN13032.1 sugar fermentation stimulation protein SfsA [Gemmatimonadales bacterium]NIN51116.1 sugar fermentation stimulation protein SfsA [Gemmatimonadales bacterium]NIP08580.1 sugar fermentation stimulation protein SfsA [Gemmatimonadales bacterium]NIQ99690.1 sugar fermentation stimulation protein SfsA [Gemmatimonadales bacterium]
MASVDTTLPNRLVLEALRQRALEELSGWRLERTEVSLGRSRIDFLLARGRRGRLALEVKSVTLVQAGVGLFPDAVTARGS